MPATRSSRWCVLVGPKTRDAQACRRPASEQALADRAAHPGRCRTRDCPPSLARRHCADRHRGTTVAGQRAAFTAGPRARPRSGAAVRRGAGHEVVGSCLLRHSPQLGGGISADYEEPGVDAALGCKVFLLVAQACGFLLAHARWHCRRGGIRGDRGQAPGGTTLTACQASAHCGRRARLPGDLWRRGRVRPLQCRAGTGRVGSVTVVPVMPSGDGSRGCGWLGCPGHNPVPGRALRRRAGESSGNGGRGMPRGAGGGAERAARNAR